jgi:hypothetical protein
MQLYGGSAHACTSCDGFVRHHDSVGNCVKPNANSECYFGLNIALNTWEHWTVVSDASGSNSTFYRDGVKLITMPHSSAVGGEAFVGTFGSWGQALRSDPSAIIGHEREDAYWLNGNLDQFFYKPVALTELEVKELSGKEAPMAQPSTWLRASGGTLKVDGDVEVSGRISATHLSGEIGPGSGTYAGAGATVFACATYFSGTHSGVKFYLQMPVRFDKLVDGHEMFHIHVTGYILGTQNSGEQTFIDITFGGYKSTPSNWGYLSHQIARDDSSPVSATQADLGIYHSDNNGHLYLRFGFPNTYYTSFRVDSMATGGNTAVQPGEMIVSESATDL